MSTAVMTKPFPPGSVIWRYEWHPGRGEYEVTRGIVTHVYQEGEEHPSILPICAGDMQIRMSANNWRFWHFSNDYAAWEEVPEDEQTHEERVLSAMIAFRPTNHKIAPRREYDLYIYEIVGALLPPAVLKKVFGSSEPPTNTKELALAVARYLDGTLT